MSGATHLVVLDFEATCTDTGAPEPQEVIELPSVLVSLAEREVVDEFSSFVRPAHHPTLTAFCTQLTSITQEQVDAAPPFPEVLAAHQAWLAGHGLLAPEGACLFLTCGDWDLRRMLPEQCVAAGVVVTDLPLAYRRWVNVKRVYEATLQVEKAGGMPNMLAGLGLELIGHHHRGIDDCRNIARIALALASRGARFAPTGELPASRYPPLPLTLVLGEAERPLLLKRRALASLLGQASGLFRTQVDAVCSSAGARLDEAALKELAPGARLTVVPRAKPD